MLFMRLGQEEDALRCLEEDYEERCGEGSFVTAALWDPLRDDPRFRAILEGMGLAD